MEAEYKYQAEYAKSNRSTCKGCQSPIGMGSLRLAILVQSSHFDGKIPNWFHFACFFKKAKVISTSDIKCFDGLKFEDQEKIRTEMTKETFDLGSYCLKSGKDAPEKCIYCSKSLKDPYFVDGRKRELGTSLHVKCFMKKFPSANFAKISGLAKLKVAEKQELLDAVQNVKPSRKRTGSDASDAVTAKKGKTNGAGDADNDENKSGLAAQSKHLWALKNKLEVEVSKDALVGMLEYNDQFVPVGLSCLLEAVVDGMMFGALLPCPDCKSGQLTYANGQYKCKGMANEWARCLYATTTPERREFKIPSSYHDVEILKNYKYKPRTRLFAEDSQTGTFSSKTPLAGKLFMLGKGPFHKNLEVRDVAATIKRLGGSIITSVSKAGFYVTSPEELNSTSEATMKFITKAQVAEMRSLDSKALDLFKKASSAEEVEKLLNKHDVSGWPISKKASSNPPKLSSKAKSANLLDEGSMQKLKMKGGAVVDPQSGLEDEASVVRDSDGRLMSAVLGMVDLATGLNSYYKLQFLQSDHHPVKFWIFRAWGRIGTDIGGTKIEKFHSKSNGDSQFKSLYYEKTGNSWGTSKDDFQKLPNRFFQMDLEEVEDATNGKEAICQVPSKLHDRLQQLIKFIFDEASMTSALLEFEIDIRKMPLGKLSKSQIKQAYGVLGELSTLLQKHTKSKTRLEGANLSKVVGLTTKFFTLIPHDFGMNAPPLLDSLKAIKQKSQLMENLMEMEVAYNLMKTGDSHLNPLDSHYAKMRSRIRPLDHNSLEFARIVEYTKKTHAQTHSSYTLEIVDIFDVQRDAEAEAYAKKWAKTENRMMLWHGSRRTNWAGILSQGLRIAPPEAPVTGYMFGKGIYFADMVSKSANYCFAQHGSPRGCMLLCEVALGNMHPCLSSDASSLSSDFQSRKGVGATYPNPKTYFTDPDGVVYPIGEPVTGAKSGSLLYNEFIVYDTTQVKQRYLVWVDFKYN